MEDDLEIISSEIPANEPKILVHIVYVSFLLRVVTCVISTGSSKISLGIQDHTVITAKTENAMSI